MCIYLHLYVSVYVTTYAGMFFADIYYGVATMSRLLKMIGLFCRI